MSLFGLLFDEGDSAQNPGAVSGYGGQAPSTPISITSSGKGTNITPTVNIVPTSNIDLGLGGNEGFVFSNANVGGNVVMTDMGAIGRSYDAIEGAFTGALQFADQQNTNAFGAIQGAVGGALRFADTQTGRAFDAVQGATMGAFNFADAQNARVYGVVDSALDAVQGATGGAFALVDRNAGRAFDAIEGATGGAFRLVADQNDANREFASGLVGQYGDLVEYNNQQWISQFENVQENFAGVVGGLGGALNTTIAQLGQDSRNALVQVGGFFGDALGYVSDSNANLQEATIGAINTVALRNQSSEAQQFDKLQDTLVKLGAGVAVVVLVAVFVLKK
jgi:hypothetical protein